MPELHPEEWGSTWSDFHLFGLGGVGQQKMVGEYHLEGWQGALVTLTLGLIVGEVDSTALTPVFGAIYADLKLGYGSASYSFSMDWAQGASIRLPAGKVTVYARQPNEDFGRIDYRVMLSASLSMGTRGGSIPPTLTQYFRVPAKPSAVSVLVPSRARGVIVPKVFTGHPSDFDITLLRGVGSLASDTVGFYSHTNPSDAAIWTTGIIMPGATQSLYIESAGGMLTNNANAIFLLDG